MSTPVLRTIESLVETGAMTPVDLAFARTIIRLGGAETVGLAAALASQWLNRGHSCLSPGAFEPEMFLPDIRPGSVAFGFPSSAAFVEVLRASPLVGKPGDFTPLILDGRDCLYIGRYWHYEILVRDFIDGRTRKTCRELDPDGGARMMFDRYFKPGGEVPDWQRLAALCALTHRFCVISGGPGTGKTTAVMKILAMAVEQYPECVFAIAAPTGKAAARMEEAAGRLELDCKPPIRDILRRIHPRTLHRLLKAGRDGASFAHGEDNLLPCDLVIVDEASMVPLRLMARLMSAMRPDATLVLVGDKDQLASVEAGTVLGDICKAGAGGAVSRRWKTLVHAFCPECESGLGKAGDEGTLNECIVRLRRNYRAHEAPGIVRLADRVRSEAPDAASQCLEELERGGDNLSWRSFRNPPEFDHALSDLLNSWFGGLAKVKNPEKAFEIVRESRILCVNRSGRRGAVRINSAAQRLLSAGAGPWYHGRPIIVTVNDYALRLFNGDMGIVLIQRDPQNGATVPRVYFETPDGMRSVAPGRVPAHETSYAVTVHKSQGSEARRVLLILPDHFGPILTKELVYTAVTRASRQVTIWGNEEILRSGLNARIERASGLKEMLEEKERRRKE